MSGGMSGDMSGADIGNAATSARPATITRASWRRATPPPRWNGSYREAQSARMAGQFADALRAC